MLPADIYAPLVGLLIGTLVALTGLGGGVLLLPILILVLRVPPIVAIGSSAVYMFFTKICAAGLHWRRGNVDWKLALAMSVGSIPSALLGVGLLAVIRAHFGTNVNQFLRTVIGVLLVAVVLLTVIQDRLKMRSGVSLRERLPGWLNRYHGAVITGVAGGFCVGLTSVGSGSVIMLLLLCFYSLPAAVLVGTDIFHAVILTGVAGMAHLRLGTVDGRLVGMLLLGSAPGVALGSLLSSLLPALWMRRVLLVLIVVVGVKML
jgi:uncharacterized membrane protein YfcA